VVDPNAAGRIGCMNQQESRNQSLRTPQATKSAEGRQHCETCDKSHINLIWYSVTSAMIGYKDDRAQTKKNDRMHEVTIPDHAR